MTKFRASSLIPLVFLGIGGFFQAGHTEDKPSLPPGVPPKMEPKDARKTLQVTKDLDFQLLAHEPMVRQPVNITFDDRGRLWVLEYLQYTIAVRVPT
jgi:hypothetical protein